MLRSLPSLSIVALILVTVCIGSAGQYALKVGMGGIGSIDRSSLHAFGPLLLRMAASPMLWLGLTLYGLGAVLWMAVLSRLPLSQAYPFLGLQYVFVAIIGAVLLHEKMTPGRLIGTTLICLGVVFVSLR